MSDYNEETYYKTLGKTYTTNMNLNELLIQHRGFLSPVPSRYHASKTAEERILAAFQHQQQILENAFDRISAYCGDGRTMQIMNEAREKMKGE